jgi:preprotein translocase subunit SecD
MQNRLIAPFAIFLVILPLLACSLLRTGRSYKWHLILEVDPSVSDRESGARQTIDVLRSRLNALGVAPFKVDIVDSPTQGRVRLDLPEIADRQRFKNFIVTRGLLQLVHIVSAPAPAPCQTYQNEEEAKAATKADANRKALPYPDSNGKVRWVVAELPAIVDGRGLRNATAVPNPIGGGYQIHFTLKPEAADKFGAWTGANINQYIGVILNDEVKSVAYIKSQISDTGQISGRFTKESAEDLAQLLKTGPLPARVKIVEEGQN